MTQREDRRIAWKINIIVPQCCILLNWTCEVVIMFRYLWFYFTPLFSARRIEQRTERTFLSPSFAYPTSKNYFTFWDVKAPDDYIISITFQEIYIDTQWDGFTHIYFGDKTTEFQTGLKSCSPWTRLTNGNGCLEEKYKKFASLSSSAKILMTSWTSRTTFTIIFRSLNPRGKKQNIIEGAAASQCTLRQWKWGGQQKNTAAPVPLFVCHLATV